MPFNIVGAHYPQYLVGADPQSGYGDPLSRPLMSGAPAAGRLELMGAEAEAARRRLVMRDYTQERGLLLPFGSTAIPLNGTVAVTQNPQVPFRPSSIIIQATAIDELTVDDIRIGKNSQFVSAGAFPASAFGPASTFKGISFDTAGPGIDIVIQMTDVSGAENVVVLGMYGVAAEV